MSLLDAAVQLLESGGCPIPMKDKRPAVRWKRYQSERPTKARLRSWFASGKYGGLGVIFGEISGGLASRDFDALKSYTAWASTYPTLASTLATVETRRGRHVYCRFGADDVHSFRAELGKPDGRGAIDLGDGELRAGVGCYSVMPPTRLSNGFEYRWLIPPSSGSLPLLKLSATGFQYCYTEDIEDSGGHKTLGGEGEASIAEPVAAKLSELTKDNGGIATALTPSLCLRSSEYSVLQKVELAITATVPSKVGRRHRAIFEFSRYIKSIPELADAPVKELKPLVRQWHERALPSITTKAFEETWLDFVEGLRNVKNLVGEEPLSMALARAIEAELPECAQEYEQEELRQLVALCRELQRSARSKSFFLAGRSAARLLGVDHWQAARFLKTLRIDGVLREVSKGKRGTHHASSYRYLPPL